MNRRLISVLIIIIVIVIIVLTITTLMDSNSTSSVTIEEEHTNEIASGSAIEQGDDIKLKIAQMSVQEKVGQLLIVGLQGINITEQTKQLIHEYKVGGFIFFAHNLENPDQSLQLINDIKQENKSNNIPLFLSVDQEGGRVTRLPGLTRIPPNLEIANKYNLQTAYLYGHLLGDQLNSFGFQFNFAPSMDIFSNPNNVVIGNRSFGNNPETVSLFGLEVIKGMRDKGVIATVKHFPGHGDTHADSHTNLPVINKTYEEIEAFELIPFQKAIDSDIDVVMTAHVLLPKLGTKDPATMSKEVITDLLRNKMNFDGVVITDDMTMGAITSKYKIEEAAVKSIQAGVDIILVAHGHDNVVKTFQRLEKAVEAGEIPMERLNESVERVLRLKKKYKLSNDIIDSVDIVDLQKDIDELFNK